MQPNFQNTFNLLLDDNYHNYDYDNDAITMESSTHLTSADAEPKTPLPTMQDSDQIMPTLTTTQPPKARDVKLRSSPRKQQTLASKSAWPRPSTSAFTQTVLLLVGPEKEEFVVHPSIISLHSPFFAAALRPNGFREADDGVIEMPGERPSEVHYFLHWVYTGGEVYHPQVDDLELKEEEREEEEESDRNSSEDEEEEDVSPPTTTTSIFTHRVRTASNSSTASTQTSSSTSSERSSTSTSSSTTSTKSKKYTPPAYGPLIRLYAFASKYTIPLLQNAILSKLAHLSDTTNSCPNANDTRLLYSEIGPEGQGKGIKALVVDLFAWKKTNRLVREHRGDWDGEFLEEVLLRMGWRLGKDAGGVGGSAEGEPWRGVGGVERYFVDC